MGLFGLSFTGVGIDYIRQVVGHTPEPPPQARSASIIRLPAGMLPMHVLGVLGGHDPRPLGLPGRPQLRLRRPGSTSSSSRTWWWTCAAEVYDKLQRLSFRFFDANTTGSIITRVTGDVQSVRMFVDQVLIQSVIMVISLTVYAIYMASLSPGLTVACLATTPLLLDPLHPLFPHDPAGIRGEPEPR